MYPIFFDGWTVCAEDELLSGGGKLYQAGDG
jgi:hypothetical protein